jgi:hypothetical protein
MISTADLVAWAKAEGLTAEESVLRDCEQAAVDYVSRVSGRTYGAAAQRIEDFRWRGGVLPLGDEPSALTLSYWDGTAWQAYAAADYRVSGRLIYLSAAYGVGGTPVRATYTAGYTPSPGDANVWAAPPMVKQIVRMLTMHFYVNRGDGIGSSVTSQMDTDIRRMVALL